MALWFQLLFGGQSRPPRWTGDPRVNVPISDLDPDKIHIVANPFPLEDLTTLVEMYAAASLHVNFPETTSNTTLRLDAPGLRQVNVRSWLSPIRKHRFFKFLSAEPEGDRRRRARLAKDPSALVSAVNVSVTIDMMDNLWKVLVDEGKKVLSLGLGRGHPEYAGLVNLLTPPDGPAYSSLRRAEYYWDDFQTSASLWPFEATSWLKEISSSGFGMWEKHPAWKKPQEPLPNVGSGRPPTLAQLLKYARAQPALPGGRNQTLPKLLGGLRLSEVASAQLAQLESHLSENWGLGLGKFVKPNQQMCQVPDLLEEIAQRGCNNYNKTSGPNDWNPSHLPAQPGASDRYQLKGIRNTLCGAEEFLGPLAAGAERARDRVKAANEERGGISRMKTPKDVVSGKNAVEHLAVLDRALQVFHVLYPAFKLYRPMVAGVAAAMQRACRLQDDLRERVRALRSNQSALWNLEWDADSDAAVLTFVMLPELEATKQRILSEHARFAARDDRLFGYYWHLGMNDFLLKQKVEDGWMKRLGLGNGPGRSQWIALRRRLFEILPFPFNYFADPFPFAGWSIYF